MHHAALRRAAAAVAAVIAGAAGLVLAAALPASAHVSVSSPDAAPGGFGKLVFRVPNESDSARTTEAVTTITWSATEGGGLLPDQFGEFEVSAGPFPQDIGSLAFPTIQTYSDGEVARWVQPVEPGAPEPESPAPMLEPAADHGSHDSEATQAESAAIAPASASTDGDDPLARGLAGVAVALAAAALLRSVLAGRRARG
jgi:periplasmic copper chaperone A